MRTKETIAERQSSFIENRIDEARRLIDSIDKTNIKTVLLSGSVARGDFCPGKYGGMIDLTVMKKPGTSVTAESLFGPDEDPDIPFHCVTVNGAHYQILFLDFVDCETFQRFDEPRKYAFLESKILWDEGDKYAKELAEIEKYSRVDQQKLMDRCLGYIDYLLSDYKKDRWYRREAFCQMHENLNTSIRMILQCMYYVNGKYAPAEDRRLYYSHSLEKLPMNYEKTMNEIYRQDIASEGDYLRRETLFKETLLEFVVKNRQPREMNDRD